MHNACFSVCALHVYSANRGQKRVSEFLELNYRLSLVTQIQQPNTGPLEK